MSADNWTTCPKCYANKIKEISKKKDELHKLYGKISPDEFIDKKLEFDNFNNYDMDNNFREDYDIGFVNNKYIIHYKGKCQYCGYKYEYEYDEKIN